MRSHIARAALVTLTAALAWQAEAAQTCHAASGARMRPLLELYTSEGCDSCPPADRWLSATFPPEAVDPVATVLAFHVDYWDRLGWKDRFALSQFTERQYAGMRANGATFVYTPQVMVQGRDERDWRTRAGAAVTAAARRTARASIEVTATPATNSLHVRATAIVPEAPARRNASLWLAYADSAHESDVAAGENRGVRLRHDHVVRSLHGPYPVDAAGTVTTNVTIVPPREAGRSAAIIGFVQDARNGDVLQTVTLALDACKVS